MSRILIIQPWISYGGAEVVSIQLAHHLTKSGHSTKVAALYKEGNKIPHLGEKVKLVVAPSTVVSFFSKSRLFLLIAGFPFLLLLTWREARGMSTLNPHNFPSLWAAGLVGKVKRIPVIWTCHNFPQTPFVNGLSAKIFNRQIEYLNGFFARRCKKSNSRF